MYVLDLGDFNKEAPQWWQNFATEHYAGQAHLMEGWVRAFNKNLKKYRGKFEVDMVKQRKFVVFQSEEDAVMFMVRWA